LTTLFNEEWIECVIGEGSRKEELKMNFYHTWLYEYILNAKWFIWTIVVFVFAFNLIAPILVWFVMNSKPIPILKKLHKREK
jgi:hypothetical protein